MITLQIPMAESVMDDGANPVKQPVETGVEPPAPPSPPSALVPVTRPERRRVTGSQLRCPHCKSREMRPQPRKLWEFLIFFQPFQCGRCKKIQHRVKLSWRMPITLLLLAGLAFGSLELWRNPPAWLGRTGNNQAALDRARASAGGQLSAFEEMMVRRPKSTLSNANIIELTKAGMRPDVIIRLIRASNPDYDLRANAVIELKNAGVDESVLVAMIDQSYGVR